MLTAFDDYPIHPSADPIAHPATGDPNHYDRYFFNGHKKDGSLMIGAAMGHYPVRGVIDGAFSLAYEGVQHSVFVSGRMPLDRKTQIGHLTVEVVEPMRAIRVVVGPNDSNLEADLIFRAKTEVIEEPRQTRIAEDGIFIMDHTRLTQWGDWEGIIKLDGEEIEINPKEVSGTRDRSWGVRGVGQQVETNRVPRTPHVFWLWAPLHFDDTCTHLALHENEDGSRWLESALLVPFLDNPNEPFVPTLDKEVAQELDDIKYDIEWEPGRREMKKAALTFSDKEGNSHKIEFEKYFTFRMRGIGYLHPEWSHGSNHGELKVGYESIPFESFDPEDISSIHIQTYCKVTYGDKVGVGVLEQFVLGNHTPTGFEGILDGYKG